MLGRKTAVMFYSLRRSNTCSAADEALGVARLFTEASFTARPFFESQGFVVLAPQVMMCRGVEFVNHRMERVIAERGDEPDPRRQLAFAGFHVSPVATACELHS